MSELVFAGNSLKNILFAVSDTSPAVNKLSNNLSGLSIACQDFRIFKNGIENNIAIIGRKGVCANATFNDTGNNTV